MIFSKVFEHFVSKWVLADITNNIDMYQYGNLKGSSTSHYLIKLLDSVLKGLEKPQNVAVITLLDFRKAFDLVDHGIAIRELFNLGCRNSLIPLKCSFLTGRKHQVLYGESASEFQDISCGVPQGTKLGPLIFLCLVNSVAKDEPIHVKYVDDVAFAELVNAGNVIVFKTQSSLDKTSNQCINVLITTNPLKCEILIVCPVKRPIVFPNFDINGVHLPLVSEVKLLGVKINSSLNWNSHIDHILKKARKCFFILYRARQFRFSPVTMFTLYTWFIRTSL